MIHSKQDNSLAKTLVFALLACCVGACTMPTQQPDELIEDTARQTSKEARRATEKAITAPPAEIHQEIPRPAPPPP